MNDDEQETLITEKRCQTDWLALQVERRRVVFQCSRTWCTVWLQLHTTQSISNIQAINLSEICNHLN